MLFLIHIFILFTYCGCVRYYPRSRTYLDYYPFGPNKYPTTPLEKLYHDLELLKEQGNSNSTKKDM